VKIWCNGDFGPEAMGLLAEGTRAHRLVLSDKRSRSVLTAGPRDSTVLDADVAYGQPSPEDCIESASLRWVEASTAGYARYDNEAFREGMRSRGCIFTNASRAFSDPCAEHGLAMMLALSRQLLPSYREQLGDRGWLHSAMREQSRLLARQTVVMLGFGSIGRRLAELLVPFSMRIYAVRRQIRSETGVSIVPEGSLTKVLAEADHVVDVLPENEATRGYVNARRIACFKTGARFYNLGRGATVDQDALLRGLESGKVGAAYLDVTTPEPLPPGHPLWTAPNCFITPHSAGGHRDEGLSLVRHFLANLAAFEKGNAMTDRIL
jgi:phosphoglycerate dehydrogenase-like enzyme